MRHSETFFLRPWVHYISLYNVTRSVHPWESHSSDIRNCLFVSLTYTETHLCPSPKSPINYSSSILLTHMILDVCFPSLYFIKVLILPLGRQKTSATQTPRRSTQS